MSRYSEAIEPYQTTNESELLTYIAIPHSQDTRHSIGPRDSEIHDYLRVIGKRWKMITSCGIGAALIAIFYCAITPSLYTANTTIELRGHAPILSTIASENLFGSDTRKIEYIKTTVAKLKLEGLADVALSQNELATRLKRYFASRRSLASKLAVYFKKLRPTALSASSIDNLKARDIHFFHAPREIQKYLSLITIQPVHETNLVHIRATTGIPELSQTIANTHATQFIEHLKRERQESIQANVQLLNTQASELKKKVAQAEDQLSAYAGQNKLLLVRNSDGNAPNHRHIESLAQMLADATGRRIKSESALEQAKSKREEETTFFDNEITQQLRASLKQAETEYATLGTSVTAAYPGMRELQAKANSLRKAIRDERRQGVQALQSQFDADLTAEKSLRQQIENEKSQAQEIAKKLIHYDVLSKEASSLRELYQAVVKQAKEIEMSASVTTSNVFVADFAGLPSSPSAPKSNLIVILVTFVGFASGILLAYLLESLSDTLNSSDEVRAALDLPILGSVPSFDKSPTPNRRALIDDSCSVGNSVNKSSLTDDKVNTPNRSTVDNQSNKNTTALITISAPYTAVSEALRTIRANILLSSADYPPRVILITSSMQGEGKTTMLANLAVTLAQANHRVLIIDADLRVSGLSILFKHNSNSSGPQGLSELLTNQIAPEQAISRTFVPNLDILPIGSKAPNPAELVGSDSMKRLLSSLKNQYDFILVDSPPVMAVADALLLSRMVDSVLFVVRSGFTPQSTAREARQKLINIRARVIGVIVNGVPASDHNQDALRYGANYIQIQESKNDDRPE